MLLVRLGTLAVGVIAIAALYFGREVFVPMALALLLSFALGPAVLLLRRWHINRVLAVISVVVVAFAVILSVGAVIGTQLAHLAENVPGYHSNITEKIHSLRDTTLGSCVRQVQQIGHGDRVLVGFQVKIGIPLFDLE